MEYFLKCGEQYAIYAETAKGNAMTLGILMLFSTSIAIVATMAVVFTNNLF